MFTLPHNTIARLYKQPVDMRLGMFRLQGLRITIPQLAIMLNRTPEYLRRRCVQPLLRHRLLTKRHEDDTHPQQAYSLAEGK